MRPGTYRIGGWENNKKSADIPLPEFWMSKHPITNAQYEHFMASGGYTTERWWTPHGWAWRTKTNRKKPNYWNHADLNQLT